MSNLSVPEVWAIAVDRLLGPQCGGHLAANLPRSLSINIADKQAVLRMLDTEMSAVLEHLDLSALRWAGLASQ